MGHAWPDDPERTERRIRGTVESVIQPDELDEVVLRWVGRTAADAPAYEDLEVRISVGQGSEGFATSVWPYPDLSWDQALELFARTLESWIYASLFAAGEIRTPRVPA